MGRISIASYTLKIRKKQTEEYENIACFSKKTDLFSLLTDYLNSLNSNPSDDEQNQKVLSVSEFIQNPEKRILYGLFGSGEYGYESKIVDVPSNTVAHLKTKNEAEILPFYFLFYLPKDYDKAYIILQRFSQYGVKEAFQDDFIRFIQEKIEDYIFEINNLVPEGMVDYYLEKGEINTIRFKKKDLPTDLADDVFGRDANEEVSSVELVIRARRNKVLKIKEDIRSVFQDVFSGRSDIKKIVELRSFDYDSVQVVMNAEGTTRVIDLSGNREIKAYFDVTDDVEFLHSSHPTFDSIHDVSIKILNELLSNVGKNI